MSSSCTVIVQDIVDANIQEENTFQITFETAKQSAVMRSMLPAKYQSDSDSEGDEDVVRFPLPWSKVGKRGLPLVLQFMKLNVENTLRSDMIPKPLTCNLQELHTVPSWCFDFLTTCSSGDNYSTILEVVSCAHFLNVDSLISLVCAFLATEIKGKSPAKIREMFGLPDDLTPEEEQELQSEFSWALYSWGSN
jgi:hypothetical protein